MEWLRRSPETTLAGLGALVGLLVMLLGLAFGKDDVWKTGMGIVGAAATLIGFLARSERQHDSDKPSIKAEVAAEVRKDVREEARDLARKQAADTVHEITQL